MKNNRAERIATAAFVIGSIIGTFFVSRPGRGGVNRYLLHSRTNWIGI